MKQLKVDSILKEARGMLINLSEGEALYYHEDSLVYGLDGCQPSNSICITTYDAIADIDWSVIEDALLARD